jgi:CubicO group peptidase (beta-lactamase class C family)
LALAFTTVGACITPSAESESAHYYPPPESHGGWRTLVTRNVVPSLEQKAAVLSTTGLDTDKLVDAWNYVESLGQQQSLLVIRHGWIAAEWDYVGTGPINSSTKSLTGLALAKAIELSDAGRLPKTIGYDSLAYHFLPATWGDSDPKKKLIKVRFLPTMCSGLEAMDMGIRDLNMALSLPVAYPPETVDQYSSAGVMLEGMIIENATGQNLSSLFRQHTSYPIGAESVQLWDAFGADGKIYFGGFGLRHYTGGGFGWYDPKTRKMEGFWMPLSGYAVQWIAPALDGRLIVISTIRAADERNDNRAPEEAGLFVYDASEQKIVRQIVPVPKGRTTGLIAEVAPGRLLGLTSNPEHPDRSVLYGVDVTAGDVLFTKELLSPVSVDSYWPHWIDPSYEYNAFVRGPDGFVWTYLMNVLVRIDPKDASVHVVGKVDPVGWPTFVGNDVYFSGPEQLRRIRNIVLTLKGNQKTIYLENDKSNLHSAKLQEGY